VKGQCEFKVFWVIVNINGMYHKINTFNKTNENNDFIIRLMVDYYYTKVFKQVIQY